MRYAYFGTEEIVKLFRKISEKPLKIYKNNKKVLYTTCLDLTKVCEMSYNQKVSLCKGQSVPQQIRRLFNGQKEIGGIDFAD